MSLKRPILKLLWSCDAARTGAKTTPNPALRHGKPLIVGRCWMAHRLHSPVLDERPDFPLHSAPQRGAGAMNSGQSQRHNSSHSRSYTGIQGVEDSLYWRSVWMGRNAAAVKRYFERRDEIRPCANRRKTCAKSRTPPIASLS